MGGSSSQSYKLIYFNFKGRAEFIRWILAAAGQPYEDYRFERDQWPGVKLGTPLGNVPLLKVTEGSNTYMIAQSVTIGRFLARKFKMTGKTDIEQAEVEMYSDQVTDLLADIFKLFMAKNDQEKVEQKKKLFDEILPRMFKLFEEKLVKTNTGYLVGNTMTLADIYLIATLEKLGEGLDPILGNFPKLFSLDKRVKSHPKIAEWIAKRPNTPM